MNPLVILSGGKDALLARETFVTDLYIYIYIYHTGASLSEQRLLKLKLDTNYLKCIKTKMEKNWNKIK